jgi:hypothetical protein
MMWAGELGVPLESLDGTVWRLKVSGDNEIVLTPLEGTCKS